jgi:hypothetical protein
MARVSQVPSSKAKKKDEDKEKINDLKERVRLLRYEDSAKIREATIKEALKTERSDILAPVYFHLGVNAKKYSVAIDYLTRARDHWKEIGHTYYVRSSENRMNMRREEEEERKNSLVGRVRGFFRKVA